jgi:hypothetical protein
VKIKKITPTILALTVCVYPTLVHTFKKPKIPPLPKPAKRIIKVTQLESLIKNAAYIWLLKKMQQNPKLRKQIYKHPIQMAMLTTIIEQSIFNIQKLPTAFKRVTKYKELRTIEKRLKEERDTLTAKEIKKLELRKRALREQLRTPKKASLIWRIARPFAVNIFLGLITDLHKHGSDSTLGKLFIKYKKKTK